MLGMGDDDGKISRLTWHHHPLAKKPERCLGLGFRVLLYYYIFLPVSSTKAENPPPLPLKHNLFQSETAINDTS